MAAVADPIACPACLHEASAAAWFLLGTLAGVVLLVTILCILDYIYWGERP